MRLVLTSDHLSIQIGNLVIFAYANQLSIVILLMCSNLVLFFIRSTLDVDHKSTLVENIAKKNHSRFPIAVLLITLICSHTCVIVPCLCQHEVIYEHI
jgi:hypothetical protein